MIQNVKKFTVGGLGGQLVSGDLEEKFGIPVIVTVVDHSTDTAFHIFSRSAKMLCHSRIEFLADEKQIVFILKAE